MSTINTINIVNMLNTDVVLVSQSIPSTNFFYKNPITPIKNFTLADVMESMIAEITKPEEYSNTYHYSSRISQQLLDNSFDIAIQFIKNNTKEIYKKLPTKNSNIEVVIENIIEKITLQKQLYKDLFSRQHRYSQLKIKHYFKTLVKYQSISFYKDTPYFTSLMQGLAFGYLQEQILMNIDTYELVEIEKIIQATEKRNLYQENTKITKAFVSFAKNFKYRKYIPSCTIAQKLGMTKNEFKNYTQELSKKNIYPRENKFIKNYDNFIPYNFDY